MKLMKLFSAALLALLACGSDGDARPRGLAQPADFFNGGGVQINRSPHTYHMAQPRWVNWWTSSDTIKITSSLNGTLQGKPAWDALGASGQSYFDPTTGQLNVPAQTDLTAYGRGVFASPESVVGGAIPNALYGVPNVGSGGPQGRWWLGLVLNLEWAGSLSTAGTKITSTGSFGTGGSPGFGVIGGCGTNCVTVTFGNATEANNLAINFVIDASNRADPPRNIKLYPAALVTQARSSDLVTSLINPDWLAQYSTFGKSGIGKIRWMTETGEINGAGITDFSQLAEYTYDSFAVAGSFNAYQNQTYLPGYNNSYGPKGSIGPQTVCIVQNAIGAHAHYTVPWGFNSTFGTQLAQAFDGCMKPGLEVHYEYCNENWNTGAAFRCFYYLASQAWPPLGPSAPFQQSISITSITPGATTTVNTATPHGFTTSTDIGLEISRSDTMYSVVQNTAYRVSSVPTSTSFVINANSTGTTYSSGGITYVASGGGAVRRGGYNAAKMMQQISDAYGPSKRARWKGVLGGQSEPSGATSQAAIDGAMFYIDNESVGSGPCAPKLCITDLFDSVQIAPYSGNPAYNGIPIQNITIGPTPTVTASGHTFTNGQQIRIYAKSGMTQIDNHVATVSGVAAGSFTINIDTTGFSAWVSHGSSGSAGNGNFAIDNALPKAADDSIALNISNPATYPTKYSYFAEQMSDATLNGTSVSNPSFGYVVGDGSSYKSYAICGTACLPGIMTTNAFVANRYGLKLDEYEAAIFSTYIDTNVSSGSTNITTTGAGSGACAPDLCSGRLWDFVQNWQYDAGTATKGPADIAAAHIAAGKAVGVEMPSIFVERGPVPNPFAYTRYFGDSPPSLGPLLAKNAEGPYAPNIPAPTWTVSRTPTDVNFGSGGSTTLTCPLTVPADGLAIVAIGWPNNTQTISSVSISGGIGNMTQDSISQNSWSSAVYSKAVTASGSPYTITITWNASASFRSCGAIVASGLASGTKLSGSTGNPQKSTLINVTSGSLIFTALTLTGAMTLNTSSTQGPATGTSTVTQIDNQVPAGQNFGFGYWSPGPSFSSPLFRVATNLGNSIAVATYK